MKKTYSKPDIMFDSFSLCTNIAAGCETKTPLPKSDACGLPYFNWVIFQTPMQGCTRIAENGMWDKTCYHVPSESNNLFSS